MVNQVDAWNVGMMDPLRITVDLGDPPGTAVVNQAQLKLGLALRASILTSTAIVACALRFPSEAWSGYVRVVKLV